MPKLSKEAAKQAATAASDWGQGFSVLDDGFYLLRLKECTTSEKPGPSGSHYWTWLFEEVETGTKIWHVTSLSPKAIGSLGAVFARRSEMAGQRQPGEPRARAGRRAPRWV